MIGNRFCYCSTYRDEKILIAGKDCESQQCFPQYTRGGCRGDAKIDGQSVVTTAATDSELPPAASDPQETDHSVCSSNTHRRHCKAPVAARSLSSQESTNRANLCLPSDSATIDEKDEIVPLSGKPYFACVMTKSQVQAPFQLTIPKSIWMLLPFACVPVVLSYRNKTWEMRYYGDRNLRRFDSGWKHFAVDNNLKIGDACFLELMDDQHLKFQVQILRGDIPREIVESGCSFDTPIMIE
ncbi:B3 domain-containing protein Os04g0386900 isoform X1 [Elaeis guineensis]|uniref:B3 domain-containing protein Os04g0386900 isoform X1 n=1 Tax=Elaeis guineensis var. tenera TaxID=51953 RepID=UPI003C6D505D